MDFNYYILIVIYIIIINLITNLFKKQVATFVL